MFVTTCRLDRLAAVELQVPAMAVAHRMDRARRPECLHGGQREPRAASRGPNGSYVAAEWHRVEVAALSARRRRSHRVEFSVRFCCARFRF